jgi:Flp pilus assembly protein TadD
MKCILNILACCSLLLVGGCTATTFSELQLPPVFGPAQPAAAPGPVPVVTDAAPPTTATVQDDLAVQYYRSDEPLRLGIEQFNRGNFGVAEKFFRDAVEKAPKDVVAWNALAASYDRVARFDLADRAYAMAIRLAGETTEILNNQGYSYMLRGDLNMARAKFTKALQREPNNLTIANNLQLLNGSARYIQRNP